MPAFSPEELEILKRANEAGVLTEDQKQMIVDRQAAYDAQQPKPRTDINPLSAGAAVGMARGFGAPVDLTTSLLNFLGADIQNPALGSGHLQEMMADIGMAPHLGEHTQNKFVERIGEELGSLPVALLPFSVVARTSKSAHPILETYRASPKQFVAAETAAAATAGVGAATGQMISDNPLVEFGGQLIGGSMNPINIASKVSKQAVHGLRKMWFPVSKEGVKVSASERVKELIREDPSVLAKKIDEKTILQGLTPGEKTLDPGLIALERAVIRSSAEAEGRFSEMATMAQKSLSKELSELASDAGTEFDARDLLSQRINYLKALLTQRASNAVHKASNMLNDMKGKVERGEASTIARKQISDALADARQQESDLYDLIPKEVKTSTTSTKQFFLGTLKSRGKSADPEDIPKYVYEHLGSVDKKTGGLTKALYGETESIDDLRTFRGRILRTIREEQAKDAPNRTKIHILDDLQSSILDDIGKSSANDQVKLAHQYSKDLNDTFTRGTVGRLLGYEKAGDFSVPENLTLTSALSESGVAAGNAFDDLIKASANKPAMRQAILDYTRVQFFNQATDKDGKIVASSVNRFLNRNKELLDKLPEFRDAIKNADKAQRIADATALSTKARIKSLNDKQKSAAALFLDAPVGRVISRIRSSKNPQTTTREIVKQLSKDETGRAFAGFKKAWVDEIFGEIQLSALSDDGFPLLDGQKLKNFVSKNSSSLKEVFSKEEMARLVKISDEASRINAAARKGIQINKILDDTPNVLVDMISRISGAQIGGRLGAGAAGTPLVAAGAGSRAVRAITNKIPIGRVKDVLIDATLDPKLMNVLLTKIDSPVEMAKVERMLHAYLYNAIPREEKYDDVPYDIPAR